MDKDFKNIKEEDLLEVANFVKTESQKYFEKNNKAFVIFLKGDLGAGKTTFSKSFAKALGITETIISPTFVLRKDYENLIHVDGYRFEKEEEGKSLALDREIEKKGKIILIEWPERFTDFCKIKANLIISFKYSENPEKRDISINTL